MPNGATKKLAAMSSKAVGDENRRDRKPTAVAPRPVLPPLDAFDQEVATDIRYVTEYAAEIYRNYMRTEPLMQPSPRYMDIQTDITPRMRAILIDWLVEVHQKFKMQPQTLFICVNVLDRYLEKKVVKREELQLIGCAALWIASKMYVSFETRLNLHKALTCFATARRSTHLKWPTSSTSLTELSGGQTCLKWRASC